MADVRLCRTADLTSAELTAIRRLMDVAFDGDFSDDDWAHAVGGWHALLAADGLVIAHAAVVERRIEIGARSWGAGYVEAVAVHPSRQRTGLGSRVMAALDEVLRTRFELGVLSSGEWAFYESLGWQRWRGPTFVRAADGRMIRTPDEDDCVMVRLHGPSLALDLDAPITCEERAGDSW
jgi:aminoglycoside 2'-N-acetyltransferase I